MPAAHHHPGTSPSPSHAPLSDKGRPTFGVNLSEQMSRDDADVPPILVKCCEAIEKYGLTTQGVYRIGGTHSKVLKLKERLDRGMYQSARRGMPSVPLGLMTLDADRVHGSDRPRLGESRRRRVVVGHQQRHECAQAMATRAPRPAVHLESARGLPRRGTYVVLPIRCIFCGTDGPPFRCATGNENERARHIRLHERVNALPDPNYSTLKYLMGHLHRYFVFLLIRGWPLSYDE